MKRREIIISRGKYEQLRNHLLGDRNREQMAFLVGGHIRTDGVLSIAVKELIPVPADGLEEQTFGSVVAKKEFVRPILERCHREGLSIVEAHSHLFVDEGVAFSGTDTKGEWEKFPFVAAKSPHILHATLVLGQNSADGHIWLREAQTVVPVTGLRIVGTPIELVTTTSMRPLLEGLSSLRKSGLLNLEHPISWSRFSRQVLAFGRPAQERLSEVTVAVIGVGGIGFHLVQQLAYLGVGGFILGDADTIEESNCNRLVGAIPSDVGKLKIDVAASSIMAINPDALVTLLKQPIQEASSIAAVKNADIVIGGTDTQLSRFVLNRIAAQYLIPYIDCGTGFLRRDDGSLEAVGGQVRVVMPDGPCLECMGAIDHNDLELELLTPLERAARQQAGYGLGADAPQPAVVSLNGVIASLAVTEVINLAAGFKPFHHYIFYDALQQRVTTVSVEKSQDCVTCGERGQAALGDIEPVFVPTAGRDVPFAGGVSSN